MEVLDQRQMWKVKGQIKEERDQGNYVVNGKKQETRGRKYVARGRKKVVRGGKGWKCEWK